MVAAYESENGFRYVRVEETRNGVFVRCVQRLVDGRWELAPDCDDLLGPWDPAVLKSMRMVLVDSVDR